MANVFKSRHKSDVSVAQTDTLVTASSGKQTILIGLQLANKGSSEVKATVKIGNATDADTGDITLLHQVAVPKNSMISVFVGDKVVMEAGDTLKVQSDTNTSLDATASFLEIDN